MPEFPDFPTPVRRIGARQTLERLQAENIPVDTVRVDPQTGEVTVQLSELATDDQRARAAVIASQADKRIYRELSEAERAAVRSSLSQADINKTLRWMAAEYLRQNPQVARQLGLNVVTEVPVES